MSHFRGGPNLWTASDRDVAVVWQQEKALLCGSCGLPRDETMDRESTFRYDAKPVRCHACKAIGKAHEKFVSGPHDPHGLTFKVVDQTGVHGG